MIDLFILVLIVWAAFSGWRHGLVKEIISTVGFLAGLLIAATCYGAYGEYLAVTGTESNMFTSVVAFLLLWIVVPIVLGLVANILTSALKGMKLGTPNSILGAAVSVVKYFILLSCVLNVMEALHIMNEEKRETSKLYAPVTDALQFLFPADSTAAEPIDDGELQADTVWIDMQPQTEDTQNHESDPTERGSLPQRRSRTRAQRPREGAHRKAL